MLFSEHEFERVLIDHVAARAHVGKGSVYRRFRSKEELYAAVVIAGIDALQKQIRAGLAETNSSYEQITTFVRLAVAFFGTGANFSRCCTTRRRSRRLRPAPTASSANVWPGCFRKSCATESSAA